MRLLPDRPIVIGRSSELEIVLVEEMVSRRHTKILLSNGQITVEDLGSTNGTFVNGERVQRAVLQDGDRVLVGTSIIKVVAIEESVTGVLETPPPSGPMVQTHVHGQQSQDQPHHGQQSRYPAPVHLGNTNIQELGSSPSAQPKEEAKRSTAHQRTFSGSIAEVPLPDVLQLFSAAKKSGTLVVTTEKSTGKIYVEGGRPIYSVVNDKTEVDPLKSFFRILLWTEGSFDMEPLGNIPSAQRIDENTEALLMEAMRQLDELKRLTGEIPPLTGKLLLSKPLDPPLKDLNQDELEVFQQAYNYGNVETVLNRNPSADLDILRALIRLAKGGYLRIEP